MKKLVTLLSLGTVGAFAHTHTHSEAGILEMLAHPFTGLDHILGIVALAGITYFVVKKIKASKQKTK